MQRPNCKTIPTPLNGAERKAISHAMSRMNASARPIEQLSDTWDWLTADDTMRVALKAWQRARTMPEANTREGFAIALAEHYRLHLAKLATDRGVTGLENEIHALKALEAQLAAQQLAEQQA